MSDSDTICALSSGAGRAGVAVVRVSGPAAATCTMGLLQGPLPPARHARYALLHDPGSPVPLDRGLVLWFPAPGSFTGEDCAEFQVHGSPAVVRRLLAILCGHSGVRPAEAGEFTRRAFLNGRLDLTQVEGLSDLIEAETEAQRRQALRQADGALGALYDDWREILLRALADLEAAIDFADEDLPEDLDAVARTRLVPLIAAMEAHLAAGAGARAIRDGVRVALLGPPNAGKSSLLNALAGRDAAIVSAEAGTTRDIVEVRLDLGGIAVLLADTAGLRAACGEIEEEGVRRARAWSQDADLRLVVLDRTGPAPDAELVSLARGGLVFLNKADLGPGPAWSPPPADRVLSGSARTGQGIDQLLALLTQRVAALAVGDEAVLPTRARHAALVAESRAALQAALEQTTLDLGAEELRRAARALGRLTGRLDVEDVLDRLFREFCIGK